MKYKIIFIVILYSCNFSNVAYSGTCQSGSLKSDITSLTNQMTTVSNDYMRSLLNQSIGNVGFRDLIQGMSEGQIDQALQSDWAPMLSPDQYKQYYLDSMQNGKSSYFEGFTPPQDWIKDLSNSNLSK